MGAVDFFLKIDGISGDSTDSKHKGEIEVESFSWGVSQTASVGGGGAGTGKAVFQDFHFTAVTSVASPNLFLKCATGEHLKEAVLIGRAASQRGQADEFMKITLTDVLVGSFTDTGSGQGPQPHLDDSVALRYRSATSGATQPTKVTVMPVSGGMLRFDQATGTIQVIPVEGAALEVGTHGGATSRAVFEYDVKILIGLLTAPNSTATLRLITAEIREAATPPGNTDQVDIAASRSRSATDGNDDDKKAKPKKAKTIRFDVIMYTPADLELTADDLTRKGKRIGTIVVDPDGDPATLATDLTKLLTKRGIESFGIRLQLRGARVKDSEGDDDENDEDFSPGSDANQSDSADEDDGDGNDRKADADAFASFTVDLVLDTQ